MEAKGPLSATTNGLTKITVGGKEYPLRFGRAAIEEMSTRTAERLTPNRIKMFTDLIYAGMMNSAIGNDLPFPSYQEAYELVEEFQDEENASEQQNEIWGVFEASRWGAKWVEKMQDVKKKMDQIMMESSQVGAEAESTGKQ